MTKKYALTGGPSSGKSTLLKELQSRGIYCMKEVAEYIINGELERGGDILPWINRDAFQKKLLETQLEWEREIPQLNRIESLLVEMKSNSNTQLNTQQEVNMVTKLPEFKGYTVDERLKQFRKVDHNKPSIDFVDFETEEGQELLAQYEESQEED